MESHCIEKVFVIASLPNNASQNTAHNLINLEEIFIDGASHAKLKTGTIRLPLPMGSPTSSLSISVGVDGTNITILTGSDRSGFEGRVFVCYTKTTY